jgi:hypothetical protein
MKPTNSRATVALRRAPSFRRYHALSLLFDRAISSLRSTHSRRIAAESNAIDGSRAQLHLVESTPLQSYFRVDRLEDGRCMLSARHRGFSRVPVAGLRPLH